MIQSVKEFFNEWTRAIKSYVNPEHITIMYEQDSSIQITTCLDKYTNSVIKFNYDLYKGEFDSLAQQGIFSDQYDIVEPILKNCVVFLKDGIPFGFAEIEFKDYHNSPDTEARVNSFYVTPEARGTGLADMAFSCIEKFTKYYYDANIITLEVFDHNVRAKKFYMFHGLQPVKVELSKKL